MKMSDVDFSTLQSCIVAQSTKMTTVEKYIARDPSIPRIENSKNVLRRYRWDVLWASQFDVAPLYKKGLHDDHIDTALRNIFGHKS